MTTTGRDVAGTLLVCGASNTDLVCTTDRLPRPGETVASISFDVFPGGKAANQAASAARCGANVVFVGAFGDDAYGAARRAELAAAGIDLRFCDQVAGVPSGLALIAVDQQGENQIITVAGANASVRVELLDAAIEACRPDVLLFPNEAPAAIVERLASHPVAGLKLCNAAPFTEDLRPLAGQLDYLICNEIEAAGFLGREVLPGEDAREAVRELAELPRRGAIVTLGEHGAVGCADGAVIDVPAPVVDVVDTTGAGDAFCGAFAAWIAGGSSFEDAVRAGVQSGSLAVTRAGAQPSLPDRGQILERLRLAV